MITKTRLILLGPLLAGVCLCSGSEGDPQSPAQARPTAGGSSAADKAAQSEREKAIRAQVDAFVRAFNAGDAKAVAALFTQDAKVTDEEGDVLEGRDEIAELFATQFTDNPGAKIEITTESLRFPSPDVAVEEGRARVEPADKGSPEITAYTVIYVNRGGQWLQSSVREHVARDVAHHDRLKDLGWMVGEWIDESDDAVVFTTCDWSEDKNFLLRTFSVQVEGKHALSGTQRIGWDPLNKQIRSWVFDSEGGFGDGLWSKNGDQWVVKATGVLRNGKTATATHIITHVNSHTMRWKSVDRTVAGHAAPDIEEFTMVRKPPRPQPKRGSSQ
ncbi:MAG TPA: SgcJ/EcaC family oxidoreductase [Isosphaeraceae bacterium]|jgi:uncharacterized protein (TIGR02246 family)|nr:SgcJ/EcaC family oxidoreductase [Isosphaeraceae bacterium]